jgi:hypothetical protein
LLFPTRIKSQPIGVCVQQPPVVTVVSSQGVENASDDVREQEQEEHLFDNLEAIPALQILVKPSWWKYARS